MAEAAALIINPAAGRGRIRSAFPEIQSAFARHNITDLLETTTAGEEAILAQRAIARGARVIVAVGGDGTCSQIANAIVSSRSECALAVLPAGTGNDFAKTLGVERYNPHQVASLVANGDRARIDVGVADGRYFVNSCGFGFDASVLDASNRVRFLKGDAVYIYSALKQLLTYRGVDVAADRVVPGGPSSVLMLTASNGRYLGGAFRIAPHASVTDGKLDICVFDDCGLIERIRLFAGALRGAHLGLASVTSASVQELTLTFNSPPPMELDGELRVARASVVKLECLPRALSVIAAPGALS